ncbi:hypothetical protein FOA52_004936 [Chlamydomonas sp. UWO 241]|nr:hypothetical protein FOA52_004936 [Chlamydomonas sp. UWO 241]
MGGKRLDKPKGKGGEKPQKKAKQNDGPLRMDIDFQEDGGDVDVSDDDVDFVQQYGSRIGFLENLDKSALDKSVKAKQGKEAKEQAAARAKAKAGGDDSDGGEGDGEADYERRPRAADTKAAREGGSKGLPVKTLDGTVMYAPKEQRRALKQADGDDGPAGAVSAADTIRVAGVTIVDARDEEVARAAAEKAEAEAAAARKAEEARAAAAARRAVAEDAAAGGLPPDVVTALRAATDDAARRQVLKEAMAAAAQKLLSGPEDHIGEARTLIALAGSDDPTITRLAMLSLTAVFKDIIPGYRIRLPTAAEMEVKVSHDVQKLRDFESGLLRSYQQYLKLLLAAANRKGGGGQGGGSQGSGQPLATSRIAVKCMCAMLAAQPHFNYTSDLLQAIVPRMAARDDAMRTMCCDAVRMLLVADVDCGVAKEAVQLVADLVRKRSCACHANVVRVLAVLTFNQVTRKEPEEGKRGRKKPEKKAMKPAKMALKAAKAAKQGRGMPTGALEAMAARKQTKRDVAAEVAQSFREADVAPDAKLQAQRQSHMLEALFEIYFRVLKHATSSGLAALSREAAAGGKEAAGSEASTSTSMSAGSAGVAGSLGWGRDRLTKKFPLLYPTLEGLARYTHLISVEYFNDLMEVFKQLLLSPNLPLVERLRLLLTASDILKGQGEALTIDRRDFYVRLYDALLLVPFRTLAEVNAEVVDHDDNDDDIDAAVSAGASAASCGQDPEVVLLACTLQQLLCDTKIGDMARVAGFVKRCATAALGGGSADGVVLMGCMLRLLRRYPRLLSMLDYEGEAPVGGRLFDANCPDPSEAGAMASTLWELCGLTHHYHPHVASAATSLLAMAPGGGRGGSGDGGSGSGSLSGPLALAGTTRELARAYDTSLGAFRPAPQKPKARKAVDGGGVSGGMLRRLQHAEAAAPATPEMAELLARVEAAMRDGADGSASAGLASHFRTQRLYERNGELRREKRVLMEKIKRFSVHLATRQQVHTAQARAGVVKGGGAQGKKRAGAC